MSITPQDRARRAADVMWGDDASSKWIGIERGEVGPGDATMTLSVVAHHCNGLGICHGGILFTLADTAFAFACNAYNTRAVAQHNTISYLAPARLGDHLTATAREQTRAGRTGIYDVEVARTDGTIVATFRGVSRAISGYHFDEDDSAEERT